MPRYHVRHKIGAHARVAQANSEPIQRLPPCDDRLMRWTILAPAVSFAALLAAPASAALSDFRLPDASPAPQPEPDRQGPVAPDVPESRRPAPTPAPANRAPAPVPTATVPQVEQPDVSDDAPATQPSRNTGAPAATARRSVSDAPAGAADSPGAEVPAAGGLGLPSAGTAPVAASPATASTSVAASAAAGGLPWLWALAALAALAALGLAGWKWWQRRPVSRQAAVPQVERPRVPAAAPEAPVRAGAALPEPLRVTLEPLRLSLTLMNATLAYRLEIANRGAAPIADLRIGADMISAHASMTREQQLSGPGAGAAQLQRIDRLEPGESRIVEGEFRVPFTEIVPIRQGSAALLLPLARFRLEAQGAAAVVRTFVVGQPGAKAGLQPFRLDQGPRIYPKLAQRAFA